MVESLKEALKKMDSLSGGRLSSPIPVLAIMRVKATKGGDCRALVIDWVEQDFVVNGFYLSDKAGNVTDYPAVLSWDHNEAELLAPRRGGKMGFS